MTAIMYRNIFCLLMGFWIMTGPLLGQKKLDQDHVDVLYLKNGSILQGVILEHIPQVSVKLQTADQNIWVFSYEEIERMALEPLAHKKAKQGSRAMDTAGVFYPEKGYYNLSQIHLWVANPNRRFQFDATVVPGVSMINGYRFHPQLGAGIGIGVDVYNRGMVMPLFADLRADLIKNSQVTPQLAAQGGYGFQISRTEDALPFVNEGQEAQLYGGWRYGFQVGIKILTASRIAWLVSTGYHFQASRAEYEGQRFPDEFVVERFKAKRLSFQVGLQF